MRYLVTGASGFIGKRLVRRLLAAPDSTVLFLLREDSRAKLDGLRHFWGEAGGRAQPLFGDVRAPGLGLRTIERRLQLDYGSRAAMRVQSAPGAGFSVSVTIPAVREENFA